MSRRTIAAAAVAALVLAGCAAPDNTTRPAGRETRAAAPPAAEKKATTTPTDIRPDGGPPQLTEGETYVRRAQWESPAKITVEDANIATKRWYSLYAGGREAYPTRARTGVWVAIRVAVEAIDQPVSVSDGDFAVLVDGEYYVPEYSDVSVSTQNNINRTVRPGERVDGLVLIDAADPGRKEIVVAYQPSNNLEAVWTITDFQRLPEAMAKEDADRLDRLARR
jgi:hypothetical protein